MRIACAQLPACALTVRPAASTHEHRAAASVDSAEAELAAAAVATEKPAAGALSIAAAAKDECRMCGTEPNPAAVMSVDIGGRREERICNWDTETNIRRTDVTDRPCRRQDPARRAEPKESQQSYRQQACGKVVRQRRRTAGSSDAGGVAEQPRLPCDGLRSGSADAMRKASSQNATRRQ